MGRKKIIRLNVLKGYEKWSKTYDSDKNPLIAMESNKILGLLKPVKNKKILDIGCGTGRNSIKLAKKGANVTGIDFSKNMLEIAKKKAKMVNLKISFKIGRVTNLPFSNNSFDKVTCNLTLSHVKNLNKALKEMKRVVKKNGIIVISDLNPFLCGKQGGAYFRFKRKTHQIRTYVHTFEDFFKAFKKFNFCVEDFVELKLVKKFKEYFWYESYYKQLEGKPIYFIFKLKVRK